MKVGYITSEYPHPKVKSAGGLATSIKNLVVALVAKGVGVIVFVYHQDKNEIIDDNGVEIHLIKKKNYQLATWYFYRKHLEKYVNAITKEKNINILEAPDWTGITAFMRFKIPLVIRFHGSDAYFCKLDKRKQKFKNFMFEKLALKRANAFIAPTDYAGVETQKIFNLQAEKIKTIHYGLQLAHFENEAPHVYVAHTILYIGTIIRKKGVFELAKIFNKVKALNPDAKLIMIGNDSADIKTGKPSTYNLVEQEFSSEAKKSVHYLGKIPYSKVKEEIKKAHVCVFPSYAETLGMVTIESMALKKPVVNTSIGWGKELIDDGVNGFLVHPSNSDEYAKKIVDILGDNTLSQTLREAARIKVETTFDIKKIVDINIDYYNSVLRS